MPSIPPVNMDIESLVFTVMQSAAKDAKEDLKAIMSQVKQVNEAKETVRETIGALRDGEVAEAGGKAGSALSDAFSASLDTIGQQSQQFQLGLQRLMADIAQAAAMASNVAKKMDDANDAVIDNIKG